MSTPALIAIIAAVLILAGVWVFMTQRRARLRQQFGPEYDRAVRDAGTPLRADAVLDARARRVKRYEIRALPREEQSRFMEAWRQLQSKFIDDPGRSVLEADRLVTDLMTARGYPMADFERHVEDLSVNYPRVVNNYREAHAIVDRHATASATTEDLRKAVVHLRALFDDLLNTREYERTPA